MQALRESQAAQAGSNFTTIVGGSDFDEEYLTNVTFGEQDFLLIVDTGRYVHRVSWYMNDISL